VSVYNGILEKQRIKKKIGEDSLIGFGADTFQLGIPLPFMLQYMFGCAVLPMGTVIEANGPQMSCKTMLMYEFGRFFKNSGGWLDMILTEGKVSTSLIRSVVGWDKRSRDAVFSVRVRHMNQMMDEITRRLAIVHTMATKGIDGAPKTGYKFPVLMGVDSIMGANALETKNKIEKEGSTKRGFPIEALILSPYLKNVSSNISGFPISLFLINHRKEKEKDDAKPYEKVKFTKSGGKQLRFQATYELVTHMVREWVSGDPRPNSSSEIENRTIRIGNDKNSAGTNGREFDIRVSWRFRVLPKKRNDGKTVLVARQITQWHWEEAIAPFLMSWKKGRTNAQGVSKGAQERVAKLDAVLHLREVTKGSFYSDTLGIPKAKPVTASVIGRMLEPSEEDKLEETAAVREKRDTIIKGIRAVFGIDDGYEWDSNVDYRLAMKKLQDFATKEGGDSLDDYVDALKHNRFEDDETFDAVHLGLDDLTFDGDDDSDMIDDDDEDDSYG